MGLLDYFINFRTSIEEMQSRGEVRRIDARVAIAQAQQRLVDAQRALANQSQEARFDPALNEAKFRAQLADSLRTMEDAQRRLQVRQHARSLPAHEVLPLLDDEYRREAHLLDLDNAYRLLLQGGGGTLPGRTTPVPPLPPSPLPLPPSPDPPIQRRVTNEEIERRALQALLRISGQPKEQQEAAWEEWKRSLTGQLPPLVVEEIMKCVERLRSMVR